MREREIMHAFIYVDFNSQNLIPLYLQWPKSSTVADYDDDDDDGISLSLFFSLSTPVSKR